MAGLRGGDVDHVTTSVSGGTLRATSNPGQFAIELNVPLTAPVYLFLTPAQAEQWAKVLTSYANDSTLTEAN